MGLPGQGALPHSQALSLYTLFQIATPGAFVRCVCLALWGAWLILRHSCSVCFFGGGRPGGRGQSGTKSFCGP